MSKTYSTTIEITEEKEYPVTIQAGLDLSAWITAGSTTGYPLNPSSYADFAALEADEKAVRQLMLVHDAVDYLAQATAGDSLMQSVINSDVCAKWISLSDYAQDILSANSNIKSVMDTAGKYGFGEWGKLEIASNGSASASAGASGYEANHAFTPVGSDAGWYISGAAYTNAWLKCDFGAKTKITDVITYIQATNNTPTMTLNFSGSDDDVTYTPIKTGIVAHATKEITALDAPVDYRYYKWEITAFTGSSSNTSGFKANLLSWGPLGNVPIMTANNAPYGECVGTAGQSSSYDLCKAFDGDTTTIWNTAAGLTTATIGYHFPNPVNVRKIQYMAFNASSPSQYGNSHNLTLEYSNDGTNYTAISGATFNVAANQCKTELEFTSDNNIYAPYWIIRFSDSNYVNGGNRYILTASLQFYGRELKPLVPTMTGNTSPKGEASASSSGTNYPPFKAFDGNTVTQWAESADARNTSWLQYDYGVKTEISGLALNSGRFATAFSTIVVTGSDDGFTTENPVTTLTYGTDFSTNDVTIFHALASLANYKAYRFTFNKKSGIGQYDTSNIHIAQFFGFDYSEKEFAQGSTRKTIYDHGVEFETILTANRGTASIVKEPNQIYGYKGNAASSGFEFGIKTDLTDYNRLCGKVGNKWYHYPVLHVDTDIDATNSGQVSQVHFASTTSPYPLLTLEAMLDISSVNGTYAVSLFYAETNNAGEFWGTIKELWLE